MSATRAASGAVGRIAAPILPLLSVALLAVAVRAGWTGGIDRALLLALAPPPGLVAPIAAITWFGDTATRSAIAAAAAAALLCARDWRRAVALVAIVAGGALFNTALKALVARPRPNVLRHLDIVTSPSFPSGHAANSAILYLALALLAPPRWRGVALALAAALVVAIGLSRIALAVHWPSDVAAGWCVGVAWLLLWRRHLERPARG